MNKLAVNTKYFLIIGLVTWSLFFTAVPFLNILTPLPLLYLYLLNPDAFYRRIALLMLGVGGICLGVYQFFPDSEKYFLLWTIPYASWLATLGLGRVVALSVLHFGWQATVALCAWRLLNQETRQPYFMDVFKPFGFMLLGFLASMVGVVSSGLNEILWQLKNGLLKELEHAFAQTESAQIPVETLLYLKSVLPQLLDVMVMCLPFFMLAFVALSLVLVAQMARRFFSTKAPQFLLADLSLFVVPFYFVWFFVGLMLTLLVLVKGFLPQFLLPLGLNLFLLVLLLYFFQGMAVCSRVLNRLKSNPMGYSLAYFFLLGVALFFLARFIFIGTLLGLAENWLNWRQIQPPPPRSPLSQSI